MGDDNTALNLGEAAHITAASSGGARFDANLTGDQRRHHSNGVWLCRTCARAIDSDAANFPVEKLRGWKEAVKKRSFLEAMRVQPLQTGQAAPSDLDSILSRVMVAAQADIQGFMRGARWPKHPVNLRLRLFDGSLRQTFDAPSLAAVTATFNELVIVSPPGTGKSTSLIQITDAVMAARGVPAVFIPLNEWSAGSRTFLADVASRHAFADCQAGDLERLAAAGKLSLALDGWNELDAASKHRAGAGIAALQREYPSMTTIVSTRRQALAVPLAGPFVEVDLLSDEQQLEIAVALRGDEGRLLLEQAWRTHGVRELVAIPLYLAALLAQVAGAKLPMTKEELLALFVNEHERQPENNFVLHTQLFDQQPKILMALASEATRSANTTIAEAIARSTVGSVGDHLIALHQVSAMPQPMIVIDALVSHHCLTKSGSTGGDISFQHQQIQEWYASFDVEDAIKAARTGNAADRKKLKVDYLNVPDWEEPILFAVERLSRLGDEGAAAAAQATLTAIEIDPMLAAEMIHRSSGATWGLIRSKVVAYGLRWHADPGVDRAIRFMVLTGKLDFADQVWPVVSDPDSQIHLRALRSAPRFRPSVLGPDVAVRIAGLSEDLREHVVSEIASRSGFDGIELATLLARQDASPKVKLGVVQALAFRRADSFVDEVLKDANEATWEAVAVASYPEHLEDAALNARLSDLRDKQRKGDAPPISRLGRLLEGRANDPARDAAIGAIIEADDFPVRDQHIPALVQQASTVCGDVIAQALVHRLEKGLEIPFRSDRLLRSRSVRIDDGPLCKLVLEKGASKDVLSAAASTVGAATVGTLIDQLLEMAPKVRRSAAPVDEATRQAYWQIVDLITVTNADAFAAAVLARKPDQDPSTIAVLAELMMRHGSGDDDRGFAVVDPRLLTGMRAAAEGWGETLLGSPQMSRYQLGEVAGALRRLAQPGMANLVGRMLDRDLQGWRDARAKAQSQSPSRPRDPDSYTSYTLQYHRTLSAIGDEEVVNQMIARLDDLDFGADAACVLYEIWDRQSNPPRDRRLVGWPNFAEVKDRRRAGHAGEAVHPFAKAMVDVARRLAVSTATAKEHALALSLAKFAYALPGVIDTAFLEVLLDLPDNRTGKQLVLATLVMRGEVISADRVLDGLVSLLEDAKKQTWLLDQNSGQLEGWLELLPFSDRPLATLDAMKLLSPQHRHPWHLRRLLSALARAPSEEAEVVLAQLAVDDPAFKNVYEWTDAFEKRGTLSAARYILDSICQELPPGSASRSDPCSQARRLAGSLHAHPEFRPEIYARYQQLPGGRAKSTLEQLMVDAPDQDGLFVLIQGYAADGRPFDGGLRRAIENIVTGHEPSVEWVGAHEIVSVPVPELRKRLFEMNTDQDATGLLATACLTALDEIRDKHGPAEDELRHPDISTGRPWPLPVE